MALKGDRNELDTDISFFINETAEKGEFLSISTAGSGAAMDNSNAVVTSIADASGALFAGVLLNDVVNIDQARYHINWQKDEVQQGGKVTLLRKGFIVTDQVFGTPTAGQDCYLANSGQCSATADAGHAKIGQFLSTLDANGYAKVAVNV
jgi:hypothetical protein